MEPVLVYDTTLRDGTQGENVNFSADEKLSIAHKLDDFGVDYIEGGWPGSNPRDMRFFDLAKRERFKHAKITAFGSTRRPDRAPEKDANLQKLLQSDVPAIAIFGKTWDLHVEKVMNNTLDENLRMIQDSLEFLKSHDKEVVYDAEHFFDGYKENPQYALETLNAAVQGGAQMLVLCDTNGGCLPSEIETIVKVVQKWIKDQYNGSKGGAIKLGIHTHNDSGMAVANTIMAVKAGAVMVQGTINGYGERCGNADLTSIVPILSLKMDRDCFAARNMKNLKALSSFVSATANNVPLRSRPFVGKSAFAHKGGVHVSAIMKEHRAYEHLEPELVGNERRVLVSDLSGKSNIEYKAEELGIDLGGNGHDSQTIVTKIKDLEEEGYQFDVADGSFKILVQKYTQQFKALFTLESFRVVIEKDFDNPCRAHAMIKIRVNGDDEITAAEGSGPVSALDNALRKALDRFYPGLEVMHLVDYKVRVIDGRDGTASRVRVLIESRDQDEVWSTIGVSKDIIEASWGALADSFQYKLAKAEAKNFSPLPA